MAARHIMGSDNLSCVQAKSSQFTRRQEISAFLMRDNEGENPLGHKARCKVGDGPVCHLFNQPF